MYLKSLEIQGFKSFPDKTVLQFDNDITAIVGPNGSGKSNISDAIRWVMGEQSTKALRGARMEDVIFGGTQKRAQVGFAEASLVLDNSDGEFKYDAKEIMVTRRFYRSGDSEYYINKQSARLRDINELFMDTGLGREGYSNISQGRIDEILSVKSTDRREIFEEAAGISKYRHRKEETEKRLANTEDNLVRIGDKISELELQVEPLKEQAEKAEKYLTLKDELKGIEIAVWLDSLKKLAQTAKKAEDDYNAAVFVLQQENDALSSLYQLTDKLAFDLHNKDLLLEQKRDEISAAETDNQHFLAGITVLENERDNAQSNVDRIRNEIAEQDSRSSSVLEQIAEKQNRISQIEASVSELENQLNDALEEGGRLAASAEGLTKNYLELRNRHAAVSADLAGKSADISALAEAVARAEARKAEVLSDCSEALKRKQDTETQLDECRKALEEANDKASSAKNMIAGYSLKQRSRTEKRDALQKQLNDITVTTDTVLSRLNMFREMERDYEGYSKAVKFVMQEAKRGALRNIHGPVSQLLRTDDKYSVALEIALGGAMQHIVVSTEQDGKYAINLLISKDMGRATFLPISAIKGSELKESGLSACTGYCGIASRLVTFDEKYRNIVENLLGRTVFCETMDNAIAMAKRYGFRFKIVTLDGQVINSGGSMTGGSVSKNAGIFSRSNEIKRLSEQYTGLLRKKEETEKDYTEACRAAEEFSFTVTTLQGELREAEDAILKLEGEEKQYSVLYDAICDATANSEKEISSIDGRIAADNIQAGKLKSESAALNETLEQLQKQIDGISEGQTQAAALSNSISERITSLKMQSSALSAEKLTETDNIAGLKLLADSMLGDKLQKNAVVDSLTEQIASCESKITAARAEAAAREEALAGMRRGLKDLLDTRAGVEARKTAAEKDIQQKHKDIVDLERETGRLETKKTSAQMEEKQIVDKLWDSYELTPSLAPVMASPIESVTAANKRISELRRKISALGTPNLGAIDEYARVSERYNYLTGQRDDVLQSKKDLEEIVKDITSRMTEIFTEEFAKINRYFGQTFTEMFGGGNASLELEDPSMPLSCGIEIKVQPPGKQLKTITLLSGGEKAFVAIALYFAILKVRPTPFCMLDEIDAALDERNVERFASYLRSLSEKTQFIVITHRRGTMEEADILFGVTMQEQGVSKILHLDLNTMEKQLGITE